MTGKTSAFHKRQKLIDNGKGAELEISRLKAWLAQIARATENDPEPEVYRQMVVAALSGRPPSYVNKRVGNELSSAVAQPSDEPGTGQ